MPVHRRSFLRHTLTRSGTAVAAGAAALMLTVSVAAAGAQATSQPDTSTHAVSFDGRQLQVDQTGQTINSVSPLSGNQFTRDIFVSQRALATVSDSGSSPYIGGVLEVGYQVGYQVDVSNGAVITGNAGITPGSVFLPEVASTDIITADPAVPLVLQFLTGGALQLGFETPIEGDLALEVKPGTIATVPIQKKECTSLQCAISLRDAHFEVNSAFGTVSVRSYAKFVASTEVADDVVVSYGPAVVV